MISVGVGFFRVERVEKVKRVERKKAKADNKQRQLNGE